MKSDQGTLFTLQLWTFLGQLLGTSTIHHTTAYNLEAHGMAESLYKTLKAALMSQCNNSMWFSQLPCTLLGLQMTTKEALEVSLKKMDFGDLMIPSEAFPDAPSSNDIVQL